MSESSRDRETAGVIAPPPLIYGASLSLSLILHRLRPLRPAAPGTSQGRRRFGALLIVGGMIPAAWAAWTMHRQGNNPDPSHPVVSLVVDGPFRISRNPIYLSLTAAYAGAGILLGTLWHLLLLPGLFAIIRRGVVQREEEYLIRRFGDDYRSYMSRVRRWL